MSLNWDGAPCSGMILSNLGLFSFYWDDCLQIRMILLIVG